MNNYDFYDEAIAQNYEYFRKTDRFWKWEDNVVHTILRYSKNDCVQNLIDCPVGTGRFLPLYENLKLDVKGYDLSKDMLSVAASTASSLQKDFSLSLELSDINSLNAKSQIFVCFRLAHLMSPDSFHNALEVALACAENKFILQIFDLHNYSFQGCLKSKKLRFQSKTQLLKYIFRSFKSLLSGKLLKDGGFVSAGLHEDNYSAQTYWHNYASLIKIFNKHNFSVEETFELLDEKHMNKENCFIKTSILVLSRDA